MLIKINHNYIWFPVLSQENGSKFGVYIINDTIKKLNESHCTFDDTKQQFVKNEYSKKYQKLLRPITHTFDIKK